MNPLPFTRESIDDDDVYGLQNSRHFFLDNNDWNGFQTDEETQKQLDISLGTQLSMQGCDMTMPDMANHDLLFPNSPKASQYPEELDLDAMFSDLNSDGISGPKYDSNIFGQQLLDSSFFGPSATNDLFSSPTTSGILDQPQAHTSTEKIGVTGSLTKISTRQEALEALQVVTRYFKGSTSSKADPTEIATITRLTERLQTPLKRKSSVCGSLESKKNAKTRRATISPSAKDLFEYHFSIDPYPDKDTKDKIAAMTGLSVKSVKTWFANARSRKTTSTCMLALAFHFLCIRNDSIYLQYQIP